MSPNNCCNQNPNCHDIKQNGNIVLASHWKYDALVPPQGLPAAAGDSKKSLDHISKLAWLLEFLNFDMILSEGRYNTTRGIAPAVLCPVFSKNKFPLSVEVVFSVFCTQKKSCIIWRIEVKIEEPYRVGLWVCALVSRKYNRNPISLALEFDTRQWAWYLDSVPRSPHNITVSSHSHISHDDPAQKSGQVGHQQSAVCVSWP